MGNISSLMGSTAGAESPSGVVANEAGVRDTADFQSKPYQLGSGYTTSLYNTMESNAPRLSLLGGVRSLTEQELRNLDGGSLLLDLSRKNAAGDRRGFGEAITDFNKGDIPFVGDVLSIAIPLDAMWKMDDVAKRLEQGEYVSDQELVYLQLYITDQERRAQATTGGMIGDVLRTMPGFAAEFGAYTLVGSAIGTAVGAPGLGTLAGGVGGAVTGLGKFALKGAARRMVSKAVKSSMGKYFAKVGLKATEGLIKTGSMAAIDALVVNPLANAALGNDAMSSRAGAERFAGAAISGDPISKNQANMLALADRTIEYISEGMGPALGEALSPLLKVTGGTGEALAKLIDKTYGADTAAKLRAKAATYTGMKAFASKATANGDVRMMFKYLADVGYDSYVEEMLEERFGDFARGLFGIDGDEAGIKNAIRNSIPDRQQFTVEAISFAVPLVTSLAAAKGHRIAAGMDETLYKKNLRTLVHGTKALDNRGAAFITEGDKIGELPAQNKHQTTEDITLAQLVDSAEWLANMDKARPTSAWGKIADAAISVAETLVTGNLAAMTRSGTSIGTDLARYNRAAITNNWRNLEAKLTDIANTSDAYKNLSAEEKKERVNQTVRDVMTVALGKQQGSFAVTKSVLQEVQERLEAERKEAAARGEEVSETITDEQIIAELNKGLTGDKPWLKKLTYEGGQSLYIREADDHPITTGIQAMDKAINETLIRLNLLDERKIVTDEMVEEGFDMTDLGNFTISRADMERAKVDPFSAISSSLAGVMELRLTDSGGVARLMKTIDRITGVADARITGDEYIRYDKDGNIVSSVALVPVADGSYVARAVPRSSGSLDGRKRSGMASVNDAIAMNEVIKGIKDYGQVQNIFKTQYPGFHLQKKSSPDITVAARRYLSSKSAQTLAKAYGLEFSSEKEAAEFMRDNYGITKDKEGYWNVLAGAMNTSEGIAFTPSADLWSLYEDLAEFRMKNWNAANKRREQRSAADVRDFLHSAASAVSAKIRAGGLSRKQVRELSALHDLLRSTDNATDATAKLFGQLMLGYNEASSSFYDLDFAPAIELMREEFMKLPKFSDFVREIAFATHLTNEAGAIRNNEFDIQVNPYVDEKRAKEIRSDLQTIISGGAVPIRPSVVAKQTADSTRETGAVNKFKLEDIVGDTTKEDGFSFDDRTREQILEAGRKALEKSKARAAEAAAKTATPEATPEATPKATPKTTTATTPRGKNRGKKKAAAVNNVVEAPAEETVAEEPLVTNTTGTATVGDQPVAQAVKANAEGVNPVDPDVKLAEGAPDTVPPVVVPPTKAGVHNFGERKQDKKAFDLKELDLTGGGKAALNAELDELLGDGPLTFSLTRPGTPSDDLLSTVLNVLGNPDATAEDHKGMKDFMVAYYKKLVDAGIDPKVARDELNQAIDFANSHYVAKDPRGIDSPLLDPTLNIVDSLSAKSALDNLVSTIRKMHNLIRVSETNESNIDATDDANSDSAENATFEDGTQRTAKQFSKFKDIANYLMTGGLVDDGDFALTTLLKTSAPTPWATKFRDALYSDSIDTFVSWLNDASARTDGPVPTGIHTAARYIASRVGAEAARDYFRSVNKWYSEIVTIQSGDFIFDERTNTPKFERHNVASSARKLVDAANAQKSLLLDTMKGDKTYIQHLVDTFSNAFWNEEKKITAKYKNKVEVDKLTPAEYALYSVGHTVKGRPADAVKGMAEVLGSEAEYKDFIEAMFEVMSEFTGAPTELFREAAVTPEGRELLSRMIVHQLSRALSRFPSVDVSGGKSSLTVATYKPADGDKPPAIDKSTAYKVPPANRTKEQHDDLKSRLNYAVGTAWSGGSDKFASSNSFLFKLLKLARNWEHSHPTAFWVSGSDNNYLASMQPSVVLAGAKNFAEKYGLTDIENGGLFYAPEYSKYGRHYKQISDLAPHEYRGMLINAMLAGYLYTGTYGDKANGLFMKIPKALSTTSEGLKEDYLNFYRKPNVTWLHQASMETPATFNMFVDARNALQKVKDKKTLAPADWDIIEAFNNSEHVPNSVKLSKEIVTALRNHAQINDGLFPQKLQDLINCARLNINTAYWLPRFDDFVDGDMTYYADKGTPAEMFNLAAEHGDLTDELRTKPEIYKAALGAKFNRLKRRGNWQTGGVTLEGIEQVIGRPLRALTISKTMFENASDGMVFLSPVAARGIQSLLGGKLTGMTEEEVSAFKFQISELNAMGVPLLDKFNGVNVAIKEGLGDPIWDSIRALMDAGEIDILIPVNNEKVPSETSHAQAKFTDSLPVLDITQFGGDIASLTRESIEPFIRSMSGKQMVSPLTLNKSDELATRRMAKQVMNIASSYLESDAVTALLKSMTQQQIDKMSTAEYDAATELVIRTLENKDTDEADMLAAGLRAGIVSITSPQFRRQFNLLPAVTRQLQLRVNRLRAQNIMDLHYNGAKGNPELSVDADHPIARCNANISGWGVEYADIVPYDMSEETAFAEWSKRIAAKIRAQFGDGDEGQKAYERFMANPNSYAKRKRKFDIPSHSIFPKEKRGREAAVNEIAFTEVNGKPWIPAGAPIIQIVNSKPVNMIRGALQPEMKDGKRTGWAMYYTMVMTDRIPADGVQSADVSLLRSPFARGGNLIELAPEQHLARGGDGDGDESDIYVSGGTFDDSTRGKSNRALSLMMDFYADPERTDIRKFADMTIEDAVKGDTGFKEFGRNLKYDPVTKAKLSPTTNSALSMSEDFNVATMGKKVLGVAAKMNATFRRMVGAGMFLTDGEGGPLELRISLGDKKINGSNTFVVSRTREDAEEMLTKFDSPAWNRTNLAFYNALQRMVNAAADDMKDPWIGIAKLNEWRLAMLSTGLFLNKDIMNPATGDFHFADELGTASEIFKGFVRFLMDNPLLNHVDYLMTEAPIRITDLNTAFEQSLLDLMTPTELAAMQARYAGADINYKTKVDWAISNTENGALYRLHQLAEATRSVGQVADAAVGTPVLRTASNILSSTQNTMSVSRGGLDSFAFLKPEAFDPAREIMRGIERFTPLSFLSLTMPGRLVRAHTESAAEINYRSTDSLDLEIDTSLNSVHALSALKILELQFKNNFPGEQLNPLFSEERLSELRADYPDNKFLGLLEPWNNRPGSLMLLRAYVGKDAFNMPDKEVNDARKDFDKLPYKLKLEFAISNAVDHAPNASTSRGSYGTLLGSLEDSSFRMRRTAAENYMYGKIFGQAPNATDDASLIKGTGVSAFRISDYEAAAAGLALESIIEWLLATDTKANIRSREKLANELFPELKARENSKNVSKSELKDNQKINDIFNENPELANQVYEALGFTGNISLESNLKNTGKTEQELIEYLQKKYPEIKLNITNNPIWEQGDNIFNQEEYNNQVSYRLKATEILLSDKAKQVFKKGEKNGWELNKILTELAIPKEQKQLILNLGITDREQIALELASNYSYTVEINTATETNLSLRNGDYSDMLTEEELKENDQEGTTRPTQHYSNLTVPGGTNYTENEIATPAITPSIKGHAEFSTDNGIGWFRSDEQAGNKQIIVYSISEIKVSNFKTPGGEFKKDNKGWYFEANFDSTRKNVDNSDVVEAYNWYISQSNTKGDTKTRRILEVQSDLFQKGRDKKDLITDIGRSQGLAGEFVDDFEYNGVYYQKYEDDYYKNEGDGLKEISKSEFDLVKSKLSDNENKSKENQFLQLLNKDSNWVTFFIKSIIQDSAKKGYEKVLFPKGETAARIEGHETIADEIRKIDKDIEIESSKPDSKEDSIYSDLGGRLTEKITVMLLSAKFGKYNNSPAVWKDQVNKDEISDLIEGETSNIHGVEFYVLKKDVINFPSKKERIIQNLRRRKTELESLGIEKLKPIEAFYEIRVGNILEKQFGKENVKTITDEYGNQWREITINQARDLANILLQRNEANQIIGQANIKAMTVLIDAVNKKADTIPHEYAHHYIAWFRDTPIVQEGIKRFGSEESLVQAIGEQVVKQKGEAYNWWKKFTNFIINLLSDKQLLQVLTDSFLNRTDLNTNFTYNNVTPQQKQEAQQIYSQYLDTKNRLYRSETSLRADETKAPDWLKEQPEIIAQQEAQGRWFYKSLEEAQEHLKKFEGDKITYIDVIEDIEQYNAKDNKFAGGYGREGREYFVPKELAKNRIELGSKQDIQGFKEFVQSKPGAFGKPIKQVSLEEAYENPDADAQNEAAELVAKWREKFGGKKTEGKPIPEAKDRRAALAIAEKYFYNWNDSIAMLQDAIAGSDIVTDTELESERKQAVAIREAIAKAKEQKTIDALDEYTENGSIATGILENNIDISQSVAERNQQIVPAVSSATLAEQISNQPAVDLENNTANAEKLPNELPVRATDGTVGRVTNEISDGRQVNFNGFESDVVPPQAINAAEVEAKAKTVKGERLIQPTTTGVPAYYLVQELKGKHGGPILAGYFKDADKIKLRAGVTVDSFFNYFTGAETSPTSEQKAKTLESLEQAGWPLERIKGLLNTNKKVNTFLLMHEQSHRENVAYDAKQYNYNDLLDPVNIEIETRASLDALNFVSRAFDSGDFKTALPVKLSGLTSYTLKDQAKSDKANKFIGRGSAKSSTARYAADWGDRANTGNYSAGDVVFISAEGARTGRLNPDIEEIQKAIDAKAKLITDTETNRTREFNLGERQVAKYLESHGYVEQQPGEWVAEDPNTDRLNFYDVQLNDIDEIAEYMDARDGITKAKDNALDSRDITQVPVPSPVADKVLSAEQKLQTWVNFMARSTQNTDPATVSELTKTYKELFKDWESAESVESAYAALADINPTKYITERMLNSLLGWSRTNLPYENQEVFNYEIVAGNVSPFTKVLGPNPDAVDNATPSLTNMRMRFDDVFSPNSGGDTARMTQILVDEGIKIDAQMNKLSRAALKIVHEWGLDGDVRKFVEHNFNKMPDGSKGNFKMVGETLWPTSKKNSVKLTDEERKMNALVQVAALMMLESTEVLPNGKRRYNERNESKLAVITAIRYTADLATLEKVLPKEVAVRVHDAVRKIANDFGNIDITDVGTPEKAQKARALVAALEAKGLALAHHVPLDMSDPRHGGTPETSWVPNSIVYTVPVSMVRGAMAQSTLLTKLKENGRDENRLNLETIVADTADLFDEIYGFVSKNTPWVMSHDAPFMRYRKNYATHYAGNGFYGYNEQALALKVAKELADVSADTLEKYKRMMFEIKRTDKNATLDKATDSQLKLLFELKHIPFTTREKALEAIRSGAFEKTYNIPADMNYLQFLGYVRTALGAEVERRILEGENSRELGDIEDLTAALKATDAILKPFKGKEYTDRSKHRMYDTFADAYKRSGRAPANMGAVDTLFKYATDIMLTAKNRFVLNQLIDVTDTTGEVLIIPSPNLETELDDAESIITPSTWKKLAHRLADQYKEKYDPRTDPRVFVNHIIATKIVNNKKDFTKVDAPYDSVPVFFAAKGSIMEENVMDLMIAKGEVAGILKHVFAKPWDDPWGILKSLDHVNQWMKIQALQASLFFPIAGQEGLAAMFGHKYIFDKDGGPIKSQVDIRRMVRAGHPYFMDLIEKAEAIGIQFSSNLNPFGVPAGMVEQDVEAISKWVTTHIGDKAGKAAHTITGLSKAQTNFMFESYYNTVKLYTVYKFATMMEEKARREWEKSGKPMSEFSWDFAEAMRPMVDYINSEVGGINWNKYAYMTPTFKRIMNLSMFSVDWTASAWNAAGGGVITSRFLKNFHTDEEIDFITKRRWPQMFLYVTVATPMIVQGLAWVIGKALGTVDDDDEFLMFQNETGRKLHADITPLMRAMPWYEGDTTGKRRVYIRWGKQANEVIRWLEDPINSAIGKSSQLVRWALEQATGTTPGLWYDLPFKDTGMLGLFMDKNGSWWGSRSAYTVNKIAPFTMLAIAQTPDAAPMHVLGPISKGMGFGRATNEVAAILNQWADQSAYANIYNNKRVKANLETLVHEILHAAEVNGYSAKKVLDSAQGAVRRDYYAKLYKAMNGGNKDEVERAARSIIRLNGTYQQTLQSTKNRNHMYGVPEKITPKQREMLKEAFNRP